MEIGSKLGGSAATPPQSLADEAARTRELTSILHDNADRLDALLNRLFGGLNPASASLVSAGEAKAKNQGLPPTVIENLLSSNAHLANLLDRMQFFCSRVNDNVHN